VGSNVTRGPVATLAQQANPPPSVNEYQQNPGVNGHTTWCTDPVSVVLQF